MSKENLLPEGARPAKNTPYTRRLSLAERSHLVFDALSPPLLNQMVIEGNGKLDLARFRLAVEKASAANPGSRLILRGFLGGCRWVDCGQAPPVREVDGSAWDGYGPDGAPFLRERLYPETGPTCEVMLLNGDPARVIIRTHHSVMDGRGTMAWAEDIFRSLRGDDVIGASSPLTDFDLAGTFQKENRTPFPRNCLAPGGKARGLGFGIAWRRKRIEESYPNLYAQAAILLAQEARRQGDGNVWFMVPVDLRSRKKGLRSTGNLSLPVYIEVKPDITPRELAANIMMQIYQRKDGMLDKGDHIFRFIPLWLLRIGACIETAYQLKSGHHSFSGIISDLGKLNLEHYSTDAFTPKSIFFIPPNIIGTPSLMVLAESAGGVDLTLSMPQVLASDGRLEAAIKRIESGLAAKL